MDRKVPQFELKTVDKQKSFLYLVRTRWDGRHHFPRSCMMLDKEIQLLENISALTYATISGVKNLLADPSLISLAREYEENRGRRVVDVGLNLFVLISDIYHRENFHSDVLKTVLDPLSPHKEGDKYLLLFLEFLNASRKSLRIDAANYVDAAVFREQGRVDLIIQGNGPKKHAIIIENKMNNAPDRPRQIPRYLEYVEEQGYICDAIVYLRLSKSRYPDTTAWTHEEQVGIRRKLICINAYDDSAVDLVSGWVNRCAMVSVHLDAKLILTQYGTLLQKLGGEIMNKPIMKQFFNMMLDPHNFRAAESLASMWEALVLYRVEAIIDIFADDVAPFHKVDNWKNGDAYFMGLMWQGAHLGLDIRVESDKYSFEFWDRDNRQGTKGVAKSALKQMGRLAEYVVVEGGVFVKGFAFPSQHEDLINHIKSFKRDLQTLVSKKAVEKRVKRNKR